MIDIRHALFLLAALGAASPAFAMNENICARSCEGPSCEEAQCLVFNDTLLFNVTKVQGFDRLPLPDFAQPKFDAHEDNVAKKNGHELPCRACPRG
jgi:hypothetical protein